MVSHGIYRRTATQGLAARLVTHPAVQADLRHGLVLPVVDGGGHHRRHPRGHVHEGIAVAPARFQQADRNVCVFRQSTGDHAASRAAANHDVIEQCVLVHAYFSLIEAKAWRG
ncbi:hypothetical protein D9M70_510990 [compost metagenome]